MKQELGDVVVERIQFSNGRRLYEGVVKYVNEDHHYYMVEFQLGEHTVRQCYNFIKGN